MSVTSKLHSLTVYHHT